MTFAVQPVTQTTTLLPSLIVEPRPTPISTNDLIWLWKNDSFIATTLTSIGITFDEASSDIYNNTYNALFLKTTLFPEYEWHKIFEGIDEYAAGMILGDLHLLKCWLHRLHAINLLYTIEYSSFSTLLFSDPVTTHLIRLWKDALLNRSYFDIEQDPTELSKKCLVYNQTHQQIIDWVQGLLLPQDFIHMALPKGLFLLPEVVVEKVRPYRLTIPDETLHLSQCRNFSFLCLLEAKTQSYEEIPPFSCRLSPHIKEIVQAWNADPYIKTTLSSFGITIDENDIPSTYIVVFQKLFNTPFPTVPGLSSSFKEMNGCEILETKELLYVHLKRLEIMNQIFALEHIHVYGHLLSSLDEIETSYYKTPSDITQIIEWKNKLFANESTNGHKGPFKSFQFYEALNKDILANIQERTKNMRIQKLSLPGGLLSVPKELIQTLQPFLLVFQDPTPPLHPCKELSHVRIFQTSQEIKSFLPKGAFSTKPVLPHILLKSPASEVHEKIAFEDPKTPRFVETPLVIDDSTPHFQPFKKFSPVEGIFKASQETTSSLHKGAFSKVSSSPHILPTLHDQSVDEVIQKLKKTILEDAKTPFLSTPVVTKPIELSLPPFSDIEARGMFSLFSTNEKLKKILPFLGITPTPHFERKRINEFIQKTLCLYVSIPHENQDPFSCFNSYDILKTFLNDPDSSIQLLEDLVEVFLRSETKRFIALFPEFSEHIQKTFSLIKIHSDPTLHKKAPTEKEIKHAITSLTNNRKIFPIIARYYFLPDQASKTAVFIHLLDGFTKTLQSFFPHDELPHFKELPWFLISIIRDCPDALATWQAIHDIDFHDVPSPLIYKILFRVSLKDASR